MTERIDQYSRPLSCPITCIIWR